MTPPLFQITVAPGDIWQSSVKIVNNNAFALTVFAEVVNFSPEGEGGHGRFLPVLNQDEGRAATLAGWIEISSGPHVIPPEQSKGIPFFVDLPQDASPGGHFAAILISTQPPKSDEPLVVQTAQTVTSLFFVRIEGDVIESADIREFSIKDAFVESPKSEFILRFENK